MSRRFRWHPGASRAAAWLLVLGGVGVAAAGARDLVRGRPLRAARDPGDGVTIRFGVTCGVPGEREAWNELADGFERAHPGVRVVRECGRGSFDPRMRARSIGETAPDLGLVHAGNLQLYAGSDELEDLGPWLAEGTPAGADAPRVPTALEVLRDQRTGRQVAFPLGGGAAVLFYNAELLREAGVPPPDDRLRFGDFVALGEKLARADGEPRFVIDVGARWSALVPWIWSGGGRVLDSELSGRGGHGRDSLATAAWQPLEGQVHSVLDQPSALPGAQLLYDLLHTHHVVARAPERSARGADDAGEWHAGRVAFHLAGPPEAAAATRAGLEWGVAPVPLGPGGGRVTTVDWIGVAMSARSEQKPAAFELLEYLASDEAQRTLARRLSILPARESAADVLVDPATPQREEVFAEALAYARMPIAHARSRHVSRGVQPAWERFLSGEVDAKTALQQMHAALEVTLAEPGR